MIFVGVEFKKAVFVPNMSVYNQVGGSWSKFEQRVDDSTTWQLGLKSIWDNIARGEAKTKSRSDSKEEEKSLVFSSLPLAVDWLRDSARRKYKQVRFQVNTKINVVFFKVNMFTLDAFFFFLV